MATGDQTDFLGRLKAVLPSGWFPDITPVLDAVLSGPALAWSWIYSFTSYAYLQTRLLTATDVFLDILSVDFFGTSMSRQDGESDAAYRARLQRALLQPRATRAAIIGAVESRTGTTPTMVEPRNTSDTGGYSSLAEPGQGGGLGYGAAGYYGSLHLPFQAFLTVTRPVLQGIPEVGGYSSGVTGYGSLTTPGVNVGASEYVSLDQVRGVSDADIYSLIASTAPAASVLWTKIVDPVPADGSRLNINFYLGGSLLG